METEPGEPQDKVAVAAVRPRASRALSLSTSRTLLLAGLALALPVAGCTSAPEYDPHRALLAARERKGRAARSIAEVLALPEREIDLGRAALLLAAESRKDLDLAAEDARIEKLAADAARQIGRGGTAREAVEELNSLLLVRRGVGYYRAGSPRDFDVTEVMTRGRGNCLSSTLLYLAVAGRLGLQVRAVSAPGHFFMRYDDGVRRFNIEPTQAGRRFTDLRYRRMTGVSKGAAERGVYLRSLSKREFLAEVLAARGGYQARVGRPRRARHDLELAQAVLPDSAQALVNSGYLAERTGGSERAQSCYRRVLALDPENVSALNNLAGLLVAAPGRPEYDPAGAEKLIAAALRRSRRIPPEKRAAVLDTAGRVFAAREDWRSAARHARKAAVLAPERKDYRRRAAEYVRRAEAARKRAPAGGRK